ncbi:SMP-30/gluconolactonase/LRE family protein [Spongiimicrobium salis]|uniref:SMP-30/gluconolactonase/LRE family protein n=1 Tax=Spongiimicrobium salis TaxID=1667022 RepID=UPI00374D72FD
MAGFTILYSSCNSDNDVASSTSELPDTVVIRESDFYPEGIAYNEDEQVFYTGSIRKGKIISIDLDGNQQVFAEDNTLVSVLGTVIDKTNNRLIVCNTDPGVGTKSDPATVGQLAQIISYDLSTGNKIRTVDLGSLTQGSHLANDVTVDNEGNIYVTDSFSPVIYKVDTLGNASVLINDPLFSAPPGFFGLNGIVYHPDNYLIVGKYDEGRLFRVSLDGTSNSITEITLDVPVHSVDGLLLTDNNTLLLASNNIAGADFDEAVYEITTSDDWVTGSIDNTFTTPLDAFPTTLDRVENNVYVVYASLSALFGGVTPPIEAFPIQKITF